MQRHTYAVYICYSQNIDIDRTEMKEMPLFTPYAKEYFLFVRLRPMSPQEHKKYVRIYNENEE